jgi:hypothetical protein
MNLPEKKIKVWRAALGGGWSVKMIGYNMLFRVIDGQKYRLDFRSDQTLRLQVARILTPEERPLMGGLTFIWVTLEEGPWSRVSVSRGGITFRKRKTRERKPKTTKKGDTE